VLALSYNSWFQTESALGRRTVSHLKKEQARARKDARERLEPWWLVVLAAVAVVPFIQTLHYDFVYDDDFQVLRNPWIRQWSNLGSIFTSSVWQFMDPGGASNYYRPVHMILHALGYQISGLQPWGFHAISILLHALCAIWVALIAFRLTREKYIALSAALIFALHPIHAESIAWVAAVTDPSCAFFYLGALYFYIRDGEQESGSTTRVALVMLLFFLALLAKELAFTFPVVVVFMDWVLHRRLRWSRYAQLAGVFSVYTVLRLAALSRFMIRQTIFELDPVSLVLSTLAFLAAYISKLLVPHDVNAFHVFSPTRSILSREFLFTALVLGAFAAGLWFFRKQRAPVFLFGFSILTLVPVLNLQGVGENVFADRYLYLPSVGSSILIPLAAREIWKAHPLGLWQGRQLGALLLTLLLVAYGALLWSTVWMWRDDRTLYTATLERSPNAMLIANNLGQYYQGQGDYEKAKQVFRGALEMWDRSFIKVRRNLASTYAGLGGAYLKQMKLQEARDFFLRAQELSVKDAVVMDNLGSVYIGLGDYKTAREYYEKALALNPKLERIHNNLAALYLVEGDYDHAISEAQTALAIFPKLGEAHIIVARAYARKGMIEQARLSYARALGVDPAKAPLVQSDLKKLEAH